MSILEKWNRVHYDEDVKTLRLHNGILIVMNDT